MIQGSLFLIIKIVNKELLSKEPLWVKYNIKETVEKKMIYFSKHRTAIIESTLYLMIDVTEKQSELNNPRTFRHVRHCFSICLWEIAILVSKVY